MKRCISTIVCMLTLLGAVRMYAQAQPRYDKSFLDSEMNRYKAYMQNTSSKAAVVVNIDVVYYRIDIAITTTPQYLRGNVLMEARSMQNNLGTISLDLMSSLHVDSVKVGGTSVSFVQSSSSFSVTLDHLYTNGELMTVQVFYQGVPGSSGFGSFSFSSHSGSPWVWTLSEPYGAKDWWPGKDHPSDKADSADIIVTCDTAFKVGSNGKLVSVTENGNGTHTFHWHESYPISTYLISVAITNYAQFSNWFKYSSTDSMEVLNYVLPEHLSSAMSSLPLVVGELQTYSNLFGLYPFINEKYGHSEFGWSGGMEHQTMTSLGGFSESLTAHELAHQWFGDMITCRTWPHIWLNEGFATYCELLYEEKKYGTATYVSGVSNDMASARSATASVYVPDSASVNSLFDWNRVYAKGAIVLHMLRHVMGDTAFFHAMYNYANDPAYRFNTAITEDFRSVCETTLGDTLGYFFNEWIYGQRYPRYWMSWTWDSTGSGFDVSIAVNQTTGTATPTYFTMPVDFKITGAAWDTTVTLFNNARAQAFSLKVGHRPLSVQLDPQQWILKALDTVRTFTASPLVLDVGSVGLYQPKTDSIIVHNPGGSTLSISPVASSDSAFVITPASASIPPLANKTFTVTFHPTHAGVTNAYVYFYQNGSGSPVITRALGTGEARTFAVSNRWNLVSLPLTVPDPRTTAVFWPAITPAYCYTDTGGYAPVESLKNGTGYWLKFSASQDIGINGMERSVDSFSVRAGWNLIGSTSEPVAVSTIQSLPPGLTLSHFYGFSNRYFTADTLFPAKGYWVRAKELGTLILSPGLQVPAAQCVRIVETMELPPAPPAGLVNHTDGVPREFSLVQNHPNPFNPSTKIVFGLPQKSYVRLLVYNTLGQEISRVIDNVTMEAGLQVVVFDGAALASGMYFYKLEAVSTSDPVKIFSQVKKMTVMK